MPIQIIREDITKLKCDAIVNAANNTLLGGGGVDGAIHRAAGRELLKECKTLGGCDTGQAKITNAYQLPCKYIIHTVGPIWNGGQYDEQKLLESCYKESLNLAVEHQCKTIAFPLISSGAYGYPKAEALRVAMDTIGQFLFAHEKEDLLVYIVVFDKKAYQISTSLYEDIQSYIDDNYVEQQPDSRRRIFNRVKAHPVGRMSAPIEEQCEAVSASISAEESIPLSMSLDERMNQIDESFSQMLLRKIDESGMSDAQCYKKANVDRKLFSKIRSDVHYHPRKNTAIAFAIALELDLEETKELLMKAGFALSRSNKFDIIIEYFIQNGNYNLFEINEALFAFDQSLLGV